MLKKVIVAVALLSLCLLIFPFFASLSMAAILSVLFFPLMKKIDKGPFPNSLAAGIFTFVITLLLFIPLATFSVIGVKAGLNKLKQIQAQSQLVPQTEDGDFMVSMLENSGIKKILTKVSAILPVEPDTVVQQLSDLLKMGINHLGEVLTTAVTNIPGAAVAFIVFLFSFFYFLADQKRIITTIKHYSIFTASETERLTDAFCCLCRSVILAGVISGLAQAVLAAVLCLIVGIQSPFTVFALVLVFSFIPLIGSAPIMIALTLSQFFTGDVGHGIIMLVGMVVIGTIDNLIRPQVIRGGGYDLHPLLGFLSALAGLQIFGVTGVFVGPVVCGMSIEIVRLSHKLHKA